MIKSISFYFILDNNLQKIYYQFKYNYIGYKIILNDFYNIN
jgi:hypothetical protein